MAKKRIFTVGFYLPGDDFEFVPFESDQSLLDADIVLYEVGFGDNYPTETYQGEPLLNHSSSVRVTQRVRLLVVSDPARLKAEMQYLQEGEQRICSPCENCRRGVSRRIRLLYSGAVFM